MKKIYFILSLTLINFSSSAQTISLKAIKVKSTTILRMEDYNNSKWSQYESSNDEFIFDMTDNKIKWKDYKGTGRFEITWMQRPREDSYKFKSKNVLFMLTNLGNYEKYGFDYLVDIYIPTGNGEYSLFRFCCNL